MRSRRLSVRLSSRIAYATHAVRIGDTIIWLRLTTVISSDVPYHDKAVSGTRCKDS